MGTARITFDRWESSYADRMDDLRGSAVRDLFAAASRPDVISLSGGMPDVSRIPPEAVSRAVHEALLADACTALQYGSSEGMGDLRETICSLMAESGVRTKPDDVIVTAGAQQGLDLLAKVFLDPGDTIITEGPTYVGALQAFSAYQPHIVAVDMDEHGMRMDVLEAELAALGPGGAKFLYTIPNFQNPAGVTMSPERRRRLLELAREYGVLVVEDDPYSRLRYEGGHILPLKALDSDNVVYLGTFSKIFAPGLRLGWMSAPAPVRDKVLLAKQGADLCGSNFTQSIVQRYFGHERWRAVLRDLTDVYRERRDAMLAALEEHFPPEARWTRPEGGFFVWVTLPKHLDTGAVLAEAVEHGVTFVPGDGFYADGRGSSSMRLAFCFAEPERITEGIRRLGEVLEDRLEVYRAFVDAGAIKDEVAGGPAPAPVAASAGPTTEGSRS
jgi:2-aminoadipate transaminase